MFCSSQYVVLRKRSMSTVTAGPPAAQSAGLDKAAAAAISPAMLTITDLTYRIEGRPLFEGASVVLPDGAKAGFVGKNGAGPVGQQDRKSTRLNSSHDQISYAVFC